MTTVRVWVGCLTHYNNGELIGAWVDAVTANAWTCPKLDPDNAYITCEETWIFDQEIPGVSGEMRPGTAARYGQLFAELDDTEADALGAYLTVTDDVTPGEAILTRFRDAYRGPWDSETAFAQHHADETVIEQLRAEVRTVAEPRHGLESLVERVLSHFDYDSYRRDLFLTGYVFCRHHVFDRDQ